MPWITRVNHTCRIPLTPLREADRGSVWACPVQGCDRAYIVVDHAIRGDQFALWAEARWLVNGNGNGSYVLDGAKPGRYTGESFGDFDD